MNDESKLMIELRVKLRYAIDVEYFLDQSRSRFDDSMSIIDDWDIIESMMRFWNSKNEDIFDDEDEFSSSTWSSW